VTRPRINGSRGPDCPFTEQALEFVLGNLTVDESAAFERHSNEACASCREERRALEVLVAELDVLRSDPSPPPADLRRRLMRRLHERFEPSSGADSPAERVQVWRRWHENAGRSPEPGLLTVPPSDDDWEPIDVPGIRVRRLFVDRPRQLVTMLVRMDAGSSYPAHRHGGVEECYVVAGDLQVAGESLGPGTYQRAESGSKHSVQSTVDGCTLLIVSSMTDELLES